MASNLCLIFVSTIISAISVSAAPGLALDLVAPPSMVDIDGLTVSVLIRNTGDESLKLLNDPRTALSTVPTERFRITSKSGSPQFTGIRVKYVPSKAAEVAHDSDFTVLAPGQSIEIKHSLAGVYNFARAGEGAYEFTTNNVFHYVDTSGDLKPIQAPNKPNIFKIAGKLAALSPDALGTPLSKRGISYSECNPVQKAVVFAAAIASNYYVSSAKAYLNNTTLDTPRYTTWFGTYDPSRLDTVRSHFNAIDHDATSTTYDCSCWYSGVYAYVYQGQPGKIYLCPQFWQAPLIGTDSQAGTILHENSHFTVNGGTEDYAYGQIEAKNLAVLKPQMAIMNADSHEYFAENVPVLL